MLVDIFSCCEQEEECLVNPKVSTSYLSSTEIPFSKSFSDLTSPCHLFDFNMAYSPAFLHGPSLCSPPCLFTAHTKSFLKSASTVWNSLPDCAINWFPKTDCMVWFFPPSETQSFLLIAQLCCFPVVHPSPLNFMLASLHLLHNIATSASVWYIVTYMVN